MPSVRRVDRASTAAQASAGDPAGWHQPDYVALVAGLASVLAVLLFLLTELTTLSVRPDVVAAVLLAAAGLAGLVAGRRRLRQ